MAGVNRALYENRVLAKASELLGHPSIFLSHISIDKPAVEAIAKYITASGDIDVYFDVNDEDSSVPRDRKTAAVTGVWSLAIQCNRGGFRMNCASRRNPVNRSQR